MSILTQDLMDQALLFREEREWGQFHTPKNLCVALSVEAAELLECFQWTRDDECSDVVAAERTAIEDEVADVAIVLSYLCHDLGIDIESAVQSKLEKNRKKYPAAVALGVSKKYNRL